LPPLTPLQERLLRLWGLPPDTYTRLTLAATHPHPLTLYPAHYESYQSLHPSPK